MNAKNSMTLLIPVIRLRAPRMEFVELPMELLLVHTLNVFKTKIAQQLKLALTKNAEILVMQLVALTLSVTLSIIKLCAHVQEVLRAHPSSNAQSTTNNNLDLNAPMTKNVQMTKLVSIKNAQAHALTEFV
jgi:hypothetical protein